jgi:hypothetical protein
MVSFGIFEASLEMIRRFFDLSPLMPLWSNEASRASPNTLEADVIRKADDYAYVSSTKVLYHFVGGAVPYACVCVHCEVVNST